ncbi:MAG: hypothetical protein AB7H71_02445, partial [Alphaproteobacteria bacterium]
SEWNGNNHSDRGFFCLSYDRFYFVNEEGRTCDGKYFRRIDLDGADQYWFNITERGDPTRAALNCQSEIQNGKEAFAKCWTRQIATTKQKEILDCWDKTDTYSSFAICANKDNMGDREYRIANCAETFHRDRITSNFAKCISQGEFSEENQRLINCAIDHGQNYSATLTCAATSYLTPEQRRLYQCVTNNRNNYTAAGMCIAGDMLTPEQRRITGCVLNNRGNYAQIGVCAAGNNLTSEQQVFASCAISTGGQPYAFAACVGGQLTINELEKCFNDGIGGSGCFGRNNILTKAVSNAFKDITEGPGPNNDLLGRDGWVGRTAREIRDGRPLGGPNAAIPKARDDALNSLGIGGDARKIIQDPKKALPWNW